jgi:hypothetical protein
MTVKYILSKDIVALTTDNILTEIPAGAVVEGPAMSAVTELVNIIYNGQVMRIFPADLKDAGRIDAG